MVKAKDLFEGLGTNKLLADKNTNTLGREVESPDFYNARREQSSQFSPSVNFATASNFAIFGLAEKYYADSINYTLEQYPYDGSRNEKIKWELTGTYLDQYIFTNEYPRTNGFVNMGLLYGTPKFSLSRFCSSTKTEYIKFYGGPHKSETYGGDQTLASQFSKANVYSTATRQDSNIEIDGDNGFSVEFWLKKDGWAGVTEESKAQVVVDVWNSSSVPLTKGRLTVFGDKSESDRLIITLASGTVTNTWRLGAELPITGNTWNHYALTFKNSGSQIESKLYLNGEYKATDASTDSIGRITGSMMGYLGALATTSIISGSDLEGDGKLSASLDEFRLWKSERTDKDIRRHWFTQVYGGTNTDYQLSVSSSKKYDFSNPVDLGVYYKFNEGIIGSASVNSQDATVLDYSGRISNGSWAGYSLGARETGSAMVIANAAAAEFKDPILYSQNGLVTSLVNEKKDVGKFYDAQNNTALYWSLPSWIISDDQGKGSSALQNLTQIMGSYFDTLYLQIGALKDLKSKNYISGNAKPVPFTDKFLDGSGLITQEIFSNASTLEYLASRNETTEFEKKIEDTKNLIYLNIYNNLVDIYKSKGTERAFKNLIRCFGIGDNLLTLNLYGNNSEYLLRDNVTYGAVRKKCVDFFNPTRFGATIYQSTSSINPNTQCYVDFSPAGYANYMKFHGNTYECESFFKANPPVTSDSSFSVPFISSSVFGCHTSGSGDGRGDIWGSPDVGNFQVFAVRKNLRRNEAYFVLTGTAGGFMPLLTSSVYKDVYDDSKWHLSLRVYPSSSLAGSVLGDDAPNYMVRFTGYQYFLDNLVNSFDLSSSLTATSAQSFLTADKRFFAGAHRTNFTGSLLNSSNAQISSMRVWADNLDNSVLQYHAQDIMNYGTLQPYKSAYLTHTGSLVGQDVVEIPQLETLVLNWDYETVSASDSYGNFIVEDVSSGSLDLTNRYEWFGPISQYQHVGFGYGFPSDSTKVVVDKLVNNVNQNKPETINSSNMITILSDNSNELFTTESRPAQYQFSFEKSMYGIISNEMLKIFSTIIDFNNLIGEPVNRYRPQYKQLEKLRQLYFERVENVPDFERFVEYYKWIDSSITRMLYQLTPASADFNPNLRQIVESHILERNKYWSKFPTLKEEQYSPIAAASAWQFPYARLVDRYDWSHGDFLANTENLIQDLERQASLPEQVQGALKKIKEILTGKVCSHLLKGKFGSLTAPDPEAFAMCKRNALLRGGINKLFQMVSSIRASPIYLDGGSNLSSKNKQIDYTRNTLKVGSSTFLLGTKFKLPDWKDVLKKKKEKAQLGFTFYNTGDPHGYATTKGNLTAPFSLYSSSVQTGYIPQISSSYLTFTSINGIPLPDLLSVDVTNYHDDSYGQHGIPMQTSFTQTHVGGRQARHQLFVTASGVTKTDRAESWNLEVTDAELKITTRNLNEARATYFRDPTAKRPVNIKNIKWGTSSQNAGNYRRGYEILQTQNRTTNNRYFVKSEGAVPSSASSVFIDNLVDYSLPRFDLTGTNQNIIVERFSSPGGPETSRGALNMFSGEYSPYNSLNFRNIVVRNALNGWYTEYCGQFGIKSDSSVNELNYNTLASYQKVNRNPKHTVSETSNCVTKKDNWWIQHAIPRSAYQYGWITSSVSKSACDTFGYVSSFYFPSGTTSVTQSGLPFIESTNLWIGHPDNDLVHSITCSYNGMFTIFGLDYPGNTINGYVNQITSSTNTISPGEYFVSNAGISKDIPYYFLNLNGPYQYPSWKQTRAGESAVVRYHRNNNIYSVSPRPSLIILPHGSGSNRGAEYLPKHAPTFKNFVQPPVSFKYKPLVTKMNGEGGIVKLINSYANNRGYFSQPIAGTSSVGEQILLGDNENIQIYNQIVGEDQLFNNVLTNIYSEVIYPRDMMTSLAKSRGRTNYAEVANVSSNGSASLSAGSNGIDRGPLLRRTFWMDDALKRNRRILNNGVQYDPSYGYFYNASGHIGATGTMPQVQSSLPNSQGFYDGAATSINGWGRTPFTFIDTLYYTFYSPGNIAALLSKPQSLAFRPNINAGGNPQWTQNSSGSAYMLSLYNDTGELNSANYQTIMGYSGIGSGSGQAGTWAYQTTWYPTASCYYYHRSKTIGNTNTGSLNTLEWRVAELSGKNPWFNSYDQYALDIRSMAQSYSIVPEFRISQHMDYYSDLLFKKKNDKFLTLDGASITASAFSQMQADGSRAFDNAFFNEYSNSDFQKYFGEFSTDLSTQRMTLKCNAVKKLLPYNGFYPSHRTLQLSSLFSQSIAPYIGGLNWEDGTSPNSNSTFSGALAVQSLLQPYFAPGIMYNTIKSGIAVDWAAYTGSAYRAGGSSAYGWVLQRESNYRIPFEALLDPLADVGIPISSSDGNNKLSLLYPTYANPNVTDANDPKAFSSARRPFIDITAESRAAAKLSTTYNLYKLGINNFLAEIPNFFLQDNKLKTIVSKRQEDVSLLSGTSYYMDIVLEKDPNVIMIDDYFNKINTRQPTTISQYRTYNGQFFGPPVMAGDGLDRATSSCATTLYNPYPEFGYNLFSENTGDPAFAQYTPPYFYGKSTMTLEYTADNEDEKGNFSYQKLFEKSNLAFSNPELYDKFTRTQIRSNLIEWDPPGSNVDFDCYNVPLTTYFLLSKSAGGAAWNGGAGSILSRSVGVGQFFEWQVQQADKDIVCGLSSDAASSTNFADMKYALRMTTTGTLAIFESGREIVSSSTVTYSANDWLRINIGSDGNVVYQKTSTSGNSSYPNGNIRVGEDLLTSGKQTMFKYGSENTYQAFHTSTTSSTTAGTVYPDVSFYTVDGAIAYGQVGSLRYESACEKGVMPLTASITPFGIYAEKQSRFDAKGNLMEVVDDPNQARNRWVISPKMETPVLDFNSQPSVEQCGRGMWSGYGNLLTGSNGIVFGIEETYKTGFGVNSGSLLQKCFSAPEMRKVGEIADQKVISEAVVAIPFIKRPIEAGGKYAPTVSILGKNFFTIDQEVFDFYYDWLEQNKGLRTPSPAPTPPTIKSESMTQMVSLLDKYVMPPELDFLTYFQGNEKIDPFVVYVFEFNHTLDSQDLADIWQGVMPDISRIAEMSHSSIDKNVFQHPLGKSEFFGGKKIPDEIRWMVFKIKRKANINYYKLTADTSDDNLFTFHGAIKGFTTPYSYNWPYDYFSLVELAQVEASTTFCRSTQDPEAVGECDQKDLEVNPFALNK